MTNRRNFLQTGALAAVGAFTIGASGKVFGRMFTAESSLRSASGLNLTSDRFLALVNSNFKVQQNGMRGKTAMRLLQVKKFDRTAKAVQGPDNESYSLLFHKATADRIEMGIHKFSHEALGEFSFYVGPVTPDPNLFEVIVN